MMLMGPCLGMHTLPGNQNFLRLLTRPYCKIAYCLFLSILHSSIWPITMPPRTYPRDLQFFSFLVVCSPPEGTQKETIPHPRAPDRPHIRSFGYIFWRAIFIFVYQLPTLTHCAWVSRLWTKDVDLTHQGQFLTPDSQIRTNCSLTHDK